MKAERLDSLDGLKGLGACVVAFAWHYQHFRPLQGSPFHSIIPVSYEYGWLMVEMFFMLSGFGMMLGYGDSIMEHKIRFKDYIVRRLHQLYPVFFFSTIVVTGFQFVYMRLYGETFVYPNFDLFHFILNIFLMQDGYFGTEWSFNGPSWCISITIMMYLLFFLVCYKLNNKNEIIYSFSFLSVLGFALLLSKVDLPMLNQLTGRGLSCFSIGVLLEELYKNKKIVKKYACVGLGIIISAYVLLRFRGTAPFGNLQAVFILAIAPLMIICAITLPWLGRILSLPPLKELGKLSVEVYLFHFPIQLMIKLADCFGQLHLNYSSKKVWLLYVTFTLVTAYSWKKIKPIIQIKSK